MLLMLRNFCLMMDWNWILVRIPNYLKPISTVLISKRRKNLVMLWWIGTNNLLVYCDGRANLVILTYDWKFWSYLLFFVCIKWGVWGLFKIYLHTLRKYYFNYCDGPPPSQHWLEKYIPGWGRYSSKYTTRVGAPLNISMFGYSGHTRNLLTCQFHIGVLFFINNSLMDFYSKVQ